MKFIIGVVFMLFWGGFAGAQNVSQFENLANSFSAASIGNYAGDDGVLWAGRCFAATQPDTAMNAALLIRVTGEGIEASPVWLPGQAAEYFDNKTAKDFPTLQYWNAIVDWNARAHVVSISATTENILRQDGQVIYEKMINPLVSEDAVYMCYYFKKNL